MPSKDETVDKPAADWACKEAARRSHFSGEYNWAKALPIFKELARMIEKYEKPPVSPELLAARYFLASKIQYSPALVPDTVEGSSYSTWRQEVLEGRSDNHFVIENFLAGVAWAKENN